MEKYFEGLLWDYKLRKGGHILFILVSLGPNTETGRYQTDTFTRFVGVGGEVFIMTEKHSR